jgi:hypothetical protein
MSDAEVIPIGSTLHECEARIERALGQAFVVIGRELSYINTHQLYKEAGYEVLGDYTKARWGWEKSRAHRMIKASGIVDGLSPMGDSLPIRERHIRELVPIPEESRGLVWQLAEQTATNGHVTAAHVRTLAAVVKTIVDSDAIDDGSGDMVPWRDLSNERRRAILEANLAEEVYERTQRQRAHVAYNTGDHEWYTPAEYINAAREVLGVIDLDPASSSRANALIQATTYYTISDDARTKTWRGRTWMNPPYQQPEIQQFCECLVSSYGAGTVSAAITLTNNGTDTQWFQALASASSAVCFPKGRIKFWHPDYPEKAAPLQGQAVCYLGKDSGEFRRVFSQFGVVL